MTAVLSIGVTFGTSLRAVILAILFHSIGSGNDAQAGFTGTFHRSYSSHDFFGDLVLTLKITYEQIFRCFLHLLVNNRGHLGLIFNMCLPILN